MSAGEQRQSETAVLAPGGVARRRLPRNLRETERALFSHEFERAIPQTTLVELRGVRASPDGFLFRGLSLLPISFAFPANLRAWRRRTLVKFFAVNHLLRRRRRIAEAVWATDDWSDGYFHWLADVLPRLLAVRDRLGRLTLLLPHHLRAMDFVAPSLEAVGARRVEYVGADEVLVCDRLLVPSHTAPSGHYNEGLIREVRRILVERFGGGRAAAPADRVYVSRGGAGKRRIVNEAEVVAALTERGFRVVRAEDHTFEEQVAIFAGARHLVSNHGAGLTNMLFMPPGASVHLLRLFVNNV